MKIQQFMDIDLPTVTVTATLPGRRSTDADVGAAAESAPPDEGRPWWWRYNWRQAGVD
jgi:hypothetical protein